MFSESQPALVLVLIHQLPFLVAYAQDLVDQKVRPVVAFHLIEPFVDDFFQPAGIPVRGGELFLLSRPGAASLAIRSSFVLPSTIPRNLISTFVSIATPAICHKWGLLDANNPQDDVDRHNSFRFSASHCFGHLRSCPPAPQFANRLALNRRLSPATADDYDEASIFNFSPERRFPRCRVRCY